MKGLIQQIVIDLHKEIKNRNTGNISALRMIIGEVQRLNKKADEEVTDEEVQAIIRKLIKSETQVVELQGGKAEDSLYINVLNKYVPKMMSKAQIQTWIMDYVDMSEFNPKMKAMGSIMKELKGKADGNLVKQVLTEWGTFK